MRGSRGRCNGLEVGCLEPRNLKPVRWIFLYLPLHGEYTGLYSVPDLYRH